MSAIQAPPTPPDFLPPAPPEPDDGGFPERVKSPRRSALELVAVIALAVAAAWATHTLIVVIVIACIVVMVMVHELGHLLAAKRGGMKVTEYFLGFGPRLWSVRRGETEYGIKALPLGGYVKIPGMTNLEEVDPEDEPRTYRQQPFHSRMLVAVAGSAMHFLMAFVLLWALLAIVGVPNNDQIEVRGFTAVQGVANPAHSDGLRPGDVFVSVDGRSVGGNSTVVADAIRTHPGRPVTVVVERGGVRKTLEVTPANGRAHHEEGVAKPKGGEAFGVIGVQFDSPLQTVDPVRAVGTAVVDMGRFTWDSTVGVVRLFSPSGFAERFQQVSSAQAAQQATANGTRVESIVGAVRTAGQAAQAGIGDLLLILVSINLFVGVFNLFPMLPLDGGHVVIAVYEKIRSLGRRAMYHADVAKLMPFTWLMLAFLGVLFATSLVNDIIHPMANPFN